MGGRGRSVRGVLGGSGGGRRRLVGEGRRGGGEGKSQFTRLRDGKGGSCVTVGGRGGLLLGGRGGGFPKGRVFLADIQAREHLCDGAGPTGSAGIGGVG